MSHAPRHRTHDQVTRQFLSSAYRCHSTTGFSTLGDNKHPMQQNTVAYQISLEGLRVPDGANLVAITVALYRPDIKKFLGAKHRVNISNVNSTKLIFLAPPNAQLVVDGITWADDDGESSSSGGEPGAPVSTNEKSIAFGTFTLTGTPGHVMDLFVGSSQVLHLAPALRPPPEAWGNITLKVQNQSADFQSTLACLLPMGCFAPAKFMDQAPLPLRTFEIKMENIFVGLAPDYEVRDAMPPQNSWSLFIFAHNGYSQVSSQTFEVPMTRTPDDKLKANTEGLSFKHLPLHSATSIVCAIRTKTRTELVYRNVGFAVIPLVKENMPIKLQDHDCQMRNVPTLKGPHSGPDPRSLSNENVCPFAVMVYSVTCDIGYHGCPVKATEVKETIQPGDQLAASIHNLRSSSDQEVGALPPRAPSPPEGGGDGRPPLSKPVIPLKDLEDEIEEEHSQRKAPKLAPPSRGLDQKDIPSRDMEQIAAGPTVGGQVSSEALDNMYSMLKNIVEEVRLVHGRLDEEKSQNQRFRDAMQTGDNMEAPGSYTTAGPEGKFVPAMEIIDLDFKRTSITHATRAQLMERVIPVNHPASGKPLVNGLTSASQPLLPLSQFGIRFDGLTLPLHQGDTPEDLMVEASFGLKQRHYRSKPLPLHHVAADAVAGRTYAIGSGVATAGGTNPETVLWLEAAPEEPVSFEQEAMLNGVRSKHVLYLRVYDAKTQFYYASASIPLTYFHRAPTLAAVLRPKDLPLFVDTTLAMVSPDASFFPLMTSQGQIHVTLLSVGYLRPGEKSEEDQTVQGPAAPTMNGFSHPKRVAGTTGGNGGALSTVVGAGGAPLVTPNIVVVPKVDLDFGLPSGSDANKLDTQLNDKTNLPEGLGRGAKATEATGSMMGSATTTALHAQRASYIKKVLSENGGKMPPAKTKAVDQAEMEFKLSYADKKKDEIRSAKIASHLRSMVTTPMSLCVARGRPETVRCPFTNPYPVSSTFSIEVPQENADNLRLHSKQALSVHLGPKEATVVTLVASHDFDVMLDSTPGSSQSTQNRNSKHVEVSCAIYSERREVVRIFGIKMECVLPIIDRTFEMYGNAGMRTTKIFFSRTFSAGALHGTSNQNQLQASLVPPTSSDPLAPGVYPGDAEDDVESLTNKIGRLCRFPVVSADDVVVETFARLDPITRNKVTAWESVSLTVDALPTKTEDQRNILVYLYEDSNCESLWETWQVTASCCLVHDVAPVQYGQTNDLAVAIKCETAFCSATNVTVDQVHDGKGDGMQYITFRAKPRGQGVQSVVVHAQTGNLLERHLVNIPADLPDVSEQNLARISIPAAKAGEPIFRRLPFTNDHLPPKQRSITVTHNYHQYATISPSQFSCPANGTQVLNIRLEGLAAGEHGAVIKYPLWIFLNDKTTDRTLSVFLVELVVGGVTPLIQ